MSDQHVGVRRRPSRAPVRRVVPLAAGLAMVAWVLALGEPARDPGAAAATVAVVPSWTGPQTVDIAGTLDDGASYAPRLYLDPETSVGLATSADGGVRVILARSPGTFRQLRTAAPGAQVSSFAAEGDTVVWLESTPRSGGGSATVLWRASVTDQSPAAQVTANVGETDFYGIATEVIVADGRVRWTALAPTQTPRTDVRSVPLTGGQVTSTRVDGEFLLTTPPWASSLPSGSGGAVTLVNLDTREQIDVQVGADEAAVCDPTWCRLAVTGDAGLIGVDLMRPDGSQRRRIGGPEATPAIGKPALLRRYVPLMVDRADGVGLSLYDATTGETTLIAQRAANVGGDGAILWWSTGVSSELVWHALDLSRLP